MHESASFRSLGFIVVLSSLVLSASSLKAAESPKRIQLFAAASTSNSIDEIKKEFTRRTGVEVVTNYASSATLANQIVGGADADLFLSADLKWGKFLAAKGYAVKQSILLGNTLVVAVGAKSQLEIKEPKDLLQPSIRHLALGDVKSVPAGKYAKQALTKLGLWSQMEPKVAAADDVRHALNYIETGAAEAGIVYATDAVQSKKVKVALSLPNNLTEPILYPMVLIKKSDANPAAEKFYAELSSPESLEIFRKYGFDVLPKTSAEK